MINKKEVNKVGFQIIEMNEINKSDEEKEQKYDSDDVISINDLSQCSNTPLNRSVLLEDKEKIDFKIYESVNKPNPKLEEVNWFDDNEIEDEFCNSVMNTEKFSNLLIHDNIDKYNLKYNLNDTNEDLVDCNKSSSDILNNKNESKNIEMVNDEKPFIPFLNNLKSNISEIISKEKKNKMNIEKLPSNKINKYYEESYKRNKYICEETDKESILKSKSFPFINNLFKNKKNDEIKEKNEKNNLLKIYTSLMQNKQNETETNNNKNDYFNKDEEMVDKKLYNDENKISTINDTNLYYLKKKVFDEKKEKILDEKRKLLKILKTYNSKLNENIKKNVRNNKYNSYDENNMNNSLSDKEDLTHKHTLRNMNKIMRKIEKCVEKKNMKKQLLSDYENIINKKKKKKGEKNAYKESVSFTNNNNSLNSKINILKYIKGDTQIYNKFRKYHSYNYTIKNIVPLDNCNNVKLLFKKKIIHSNKYDKNIPLRKLSKRFKSYNILMKKEDSFYSNTDEGNKNNFYKNDITDDDKTNSNLNSYIFQNKYKQIPGSFQTDPIFNKLNKRNINSTINEKLSEIDYSNPNKMDNEEINTIVNNDINEMKILENEKEKLHNISEIKKEDNENGNKEEGEEEEEVEVEENKEERYLDKIRNNYKKISSFDSQKILNKIYETSKKNKILKKKLTNSEIINELTKKISSMEKMQQNKDENEEKNNENEEKKSNENEEKKSNENEEKQINEYEEKKNNENEEKKNNENDEQNNKTVELNNKTDELTNQTDEQNNKNDEKNNKNDEKNNKNDNINLTQRLKRRIIDCKNEKLKWGNTQIIIDIDDTVKSSGGYKFFNYALGGVDTQYQRGETYPGSFQFIFELSMNKLLPESKPLLLSVLTARIPQVPITDDSYINKKFNEVAERRGVKNWGIDCNNKILYSTLKEWVWNETRGEKKFFNFKQLHKYVIQQNSMVRYIWIGDTGDMDKQAGEMMIKTYPQRIRAVFLHHVKGKDDNTLLPNDYFIKSVPIFFFRTYVGAATKAHAYNLIDKKGLTRVLVQAVLDLEKSKTASDSSKWNDLIEDIILSNAIDELDKYNAETVNRTKKIIAQKMKEIGERKLQFIN